MSYRKTAMCAVAIFALFFSGCGGESDGLRAQLTDVNAQLEEAKTSLSSKSEEAKSLKNQVDNLQAQVAELEAKVEEAGPWFEMEEQQKQQKIAELEAQKAAEEQKKKEQEEAARLAKEKEEKQGYDTGITFDQLARTPDDYEGKKVKFKGTVLQVLEGDSDVNMRLAVNDDYDAIVFVAYNKNIVSSRILEYDTITIYGVSNGLYSYESTMGVPITIPSIYVDKIDQ